MAKNKVKTKAWGLGVGTGFAGAAGLGGFGGFGGFVGPASNSFIGPSLQQRLLGYAAASTLVTINLENSFFRGRVIAVDGNAFEMTVSDPGTTGFTPGAIVTVNFQQVNAISAGSF
jgi:hypothetical protein